MVRTTPLQRPLLMDDRGQVIDTAVRLKAEKYELGMYVRRTDAKSGAVTHAILQAIEQDQVTLYPTTHSHGGKPIVVTADELISTWAAVFDASELLESSPLSCWPLLGPEADAAVMSSLAKSQFLSALYNVYDHFQKLAELPIMINQKPSRHVVATEDIKAGGLVLVPFSNNVSFAAAPEECKTMVQVVCEDYRDPSSPQHPLHIAPFYSPPTTKKPTVGRVVPFWAVARLDASKEDDDEVNCALVPYVISSAIVFPVMQGHTARHSQQRVAIPVLTLTKDVKKGAKLQWCDKSWKLPRKPVKAVMAGKKLMEEVAATEPRGTKRAAGPMVGPADMDDM